MRPTLLTAALLLIAMPGLAQERQAPAPKGVPSIMVDPDAPVGSRAKAKTEREKAEGKAAARERSAADSKKANPPQRTTRRRTPLPVPTTGTAGLAGINRSLEVQGQQMRQQDQRQFELNQIRSGAGGSLSCSPGSLGC
jgi:hypothetical protein